MQVLAVVLTVMASSASSAGTSRECWDTARTQAALNECAQKDYETADREMNVVYKQLLSMDDPIFREKLKAAQRAWLVFRDAHVTSKYPDSHAWYGSAMPQCMASLLAEMTRERTTQLRRFLRPTEEFCDNNGGPAVAK